MRARIAALLIAALLLVPLAQARDGHGELVASDVGELNGAANATGTNLTLVHFADGRSLTLEGAFTVVHESTTYYENGSRDEDTTRRSFDDATLATLPDTVAAARLSGAIRLDAAPPEEYGRTDDPELIVSAGAPPRPVAAAANVSTRTRTTGSDAATSAPTPGSSQDASPDRTIRLAHGFALWRNLTVASTVPLQSSSVATLYVVNGTVRVDGPNGSTTYDTSIRRHRRTVCDQRVGGQCVQSHEEQVTVVNRTRALVDAADLAAGSRAPPEDRPATAASAPATFLTGDVVDLQVNATLHLQEATGRIVVGDRSWQVDHEPVTVGGELSIRLSTAAGTGTYGAAFDGDVRYVKAPVERTFPPEAVAAGAVGGAVLLGLLVYLWPALKFAATKLAVVPLFSQVEGEDVLDNDTRRRIFEAIRSDPGLSASDLADAADCGWGTVVYHLAVLEQNGLAVSTRDGRHRRFFPYKGMDFRHKDVFSAIRNETTAAILNAVRDRPGIHQKALRKEMDLAASTVNWHISKLEDAGLIEKERDGRKVRYAPGPNVDVLGEDDLERAAGG